MGDKLMISGKMTKILGDMISGEMTFRLLDYFCSKRFCEL